MVDKTHKKVKQYESEAIDMRVDAYNAVSKIYQTNSSKMATKVDQTTSANDKLEISQTAKNYQVAKSAVAEASDVREDKVADIKSQMAAGTYSVSSEDIADKILGSQMTLSF